MSASASRLSPDDDRRLDALLQQVRKARETEMGYPTNADFDYSRLMPFLEFPLNNCGDPFVPTRFRLNTHDFEREVLKIFAQLTAFPLHESWGYVTNGGTEGNMYGLFLAREMLPTGIVYFSEDTHYSVPKILRCLNMRHIMIRSQPDGRMDLEDLRETLRLHRDVPPILFANIGTTVKGAIDDLAGIRKILRDFAIHQHYIHADAALSGMILPFVDHPQPWNHEAGADSISISGHKLIGSPMPCGVVMARKAFVDRIARSVEYVGTLDTTLSGSRNGYTPLVLWYAFKSLGLDGFRSRIEACLDMAQHATDRLNELGRHAWRNENSITVVFDKPAEAIVRKWQLATERDIAHLITVPHVHKEQINGLIQDLRREAS